MIPADLRLRITLYLVLDLLLIAVCGAMMIASGTLAWLGLYVFVTSLLTVVFFVLPARRSAR